MKRVKLGVTLAMALATTSAMAQQSDPSLDAIMDFAAKSCVFETIDDVAGPFKAAKKAAIATGLPVVVEDEKTGIYGDLSEMFIIVTAGLDNLSCVVKFPASVMGHDGFEQLETMVSATFNSRFPGHMTDPNEDPSPHVDGRDWVIDTAAKDHIAVTLSFGTEDGVQLSSAAQKTYE